MSALTTIDDREPLSSLNEAFKNLYVNLYRDKYVKGERELREGKERATIPQQQALSVSRDGKIADKVMDLLDENTPLFFGSIRKKVKDKNPKNEEEEKEAFKEVIHEFATLNSWLTSVLMDRDEEGNIKRGVNNDEHAKPFPSMLVFGGGIAQASDWSGSDSEFREALKRNKAFAEYYLKEIKNNGMDITPFVKIDKKSSKLMQILHYGFNEMKNSTTLNYFGIYLSEAKINKEKNNVFFDKLVTEEEGGGMLKLMPRKGLIKAFVDESITKFAIESGLLEGKGTFEKTKELLTGATTDNKAYYNQEQVLSYDVVDEPVRYDNLYNHLENVINSGELGKYIETVADNINYIMEFLCDHYNKDLYKRTFLNCMLIKLMLGEAKAYGFRGKAKATAGEDTGEPVELFAGTADEKTGQFFHGVATSELKKNTTSNKPTELVYDKQKKDGVVYTPPGLKHVKTPSSQPRGMLARELMHKEKDDYIDDFMKAYIHENEESLELKNWFNDPNEEEEEASVKIREIFTELMGENFWVVLENSQGYESSDSQSESNIWNDFQIEGNIWSALRNVIADENSGVMGKTFNEEQLKGIIMEKDPTLKSYQTQHLDKLNATFEKVFGSMVKGNFLEIAPASSSSRWNRYTIVNVPYFKFSGSQGGKKKKWRGEKKKTRRRKKRTKKRRRKKKKTRKSKRKKKRTKKKRRRRKKKTRRKRS